MNIKRKQGRSLCQPDKLYDLNKVQSISVMPRFQYYDPQIFCPGLFLGFEVHSLSWLGGTSKPRKSLSVSSIPENSENLTVTCNAQLNPVTFPRHSYNTYLNTLLASSLAMCKCCAPVVLCVNWTDTKNNSGTGTTCGPTAEKH